MDFINLAEEVFDKLPEKKTTIRKGRKNYRLGHAWMISLEKGRRAAIHINSLMICKLGNVYECDLKNDGFKDWGDLHEGLKKYYPNLTWDDELTVVKFSTVEILD